jgi:hypothetical protein
MCGASTSPNETVSLDAVVTYLLHPSSPRSSAPERNHLFSAFMICGSASGGSRDRNGALEKPPAVLLFGQQIEGWHD